MMNDLPLSRRNMLGAGVAGTLAIGSLTTRASQAAPGKQPAARKRPKGGEGDNTRAGHAEEEGGRKKGGGPNRKP